MAAAVTGRLALLREKISLIVQQKEPLKPDNSILKRCAFDGLRCKADYLLKSDSNNGIGHCKSCQGFFEECSHCAC